MDPQAEPSRSAWSAMAVFSTVLTLAISIVLAVSPWLSGNTEDNSSKNFIPFIAFYIWMIALLSLSVIAMIIIARLRKDSNHMERYDDSGEPQSDSKHVKQDGSSEEPQSDCNHVKQGDSSGEPKSDSNYVKQGDSSGEPQSEFTRTVYLIALTVFGLVTVTHQGDLLFQISHGPRPFPKEFEYALVFFVGVYSLCQLTFLLYCHNRLKCKSGMTRFLLSFIASGNGCLCINFTMNIFYASELFSCNTKSHDQDSDSIIGPGFSSADSKNAGTERVFFQFVYPSPTEFCILSFYMIAHLWNVYSNDSNQEEGMQTSTSKCETRSGGNRCTVLKSAVLKSVLFLSKYALYLSIVVSVFNFTFQAVLFSKYSLPFIHNITCIENTYMGNSSKNCDTFSEHVGKAIGYYQQTIFAYIESIVTFAGYMTIRKVKFRFLRYTSDDFLLLICATGSLTLVTFTAADAASMLHLGCDEEIWYFVKMILLYVWLYCQSTMLIKCSKTKYSQKLQGDHRVIVQGIITFMCVCNTVKWAKNNFLSQSTLAYSWDYEEYVVYSQNNWFLLTKLFNAFYCLYRLISATLCYKALLILKRGSNSDETVPLIPNEHSERNSYQTTQRNCTSDPE